MVAAGMDRACPWEAADGVSADWWSDTPAEGETALTASLEAFCAEAASALANREPDDIEAAERAAVFGSEKEAEWWQWQRVTETPKSALHA